jgi:hypothetical protein
MRCALAVVVVLLLTRGASAFSIVLTTDVAKTRIEVVDLPGNGDLFLVGWDDLPGATPSGAMVYYRDQAPRETRYFAVGGGGAFSIVDRGGRTLINGTVVPIYDVVQRDPDHPMRMRVESGARLSGTALQAKYEAFEHVAAPSEGRPAIDAAVASAAARTNKACRSSIAPQIQWADFAKAGKTALAKQTIAIFEALESICADRDYAAAVQRVTALRIELRSVRGLELAISGPTLSATFSDTSFNPRETSRLWLVNHL